MRFNSSVTNISKALLPSGNEGPKGEAGPAGPKGDAGQAGEAGVGVPAGGTVGQVITKTGDNDFATAWQDVTVTNANFDGGFF